MASNVAHSHKTVFNWPMPRQEWIDGKFIKHDDHEHEPWVELFIDLAYVLLLSALGHTVTYCNMSVRVFFLTSLLFWIIALTKQALDEYTNRFYCHDLVQKSTFLLYTIGICTQVYSFVVLEYGNEKSHGYCSESSDAFSSGFAVGVLITRICLLIFYSLVMYHHIPSRKQFQFDVARWSLTGLLMIILLIINANGGGSDVVNFVIFGAVVVVELVVWLISRVAYRSYFVFPVDLELLQSRWGVWVMLILGESFLQLLSSIKTSVHKHDQSYHFMVFLAVAMMLLYSLGMQYFDACHVEWFLHALTKSAVAGVSWVWLHVPMTYYLFRIGLWLNILAKAYAEHHHLAESDAGMFSVCVGCVQALLTFIRMSNAMPDSSTSLVYHVVSMESRIIVTYIVRFLVAVVQIMVGFLGITDPLELLLIHCGISVFTTVIDVYNEIKHNETLRKDEEARKESSIAIKSLRQFPRQWSRLQLYNKESVLELNLMDDHGSGHSISSKGEHKLSGKASEKEVKPVATIDLKKEIRKAVLQSQRSAHFDGLLMRGEESMKKLSTSSKASTKGSSKSSTSGSSKSSKLLSKIPFLPNMPWQKKAAIAVLDNFSESDREESYRPLGEDAPMRDSMRNIPFEDDVRVTIEQNLAALEPLHLARVVPLSAKMKMKSNNFTQEQLTESPTATEGRVLDIGRTDMLDGKLAEDKDSLRDEKE